ncbi:MAG TPA: segregation/condensation protein A [Phycisphaerae bacterium]|nr:segregation/condensation protein A [Phycisphaerae bacterium]
MPDYRVQTDIYNGPMDLLLYLIRRNEIDLYDIPIALITAQYCEYVEMLSVIDPNAAGDFLVMAAALMEMKSRMLLPRTIGPEGEEEDLSDPRLELVRQLLEYKRFKDASFELGAAAQAQAMRWPRTPAKATGSEPSEVDLEDVQIWDLVTAFTKLMASIGVAKATHDVVFDDTPIALHAADILDRLQGEGGELSFEAVFVGRNKIEMIGLFLALLELMRQQRVRITQAKSFGPIKILLLSAEPIQVEEGGGPAFREALLGPDRADVAQPPIGEAGSTTDQASMTATTEASRAEEEEDSEIEHFEELDRIKTDVDIDAVLQEGSACGPAQDQNTPASEPPPAESDNQGSEEKAS